MVRRLPSGLASSAQLLWLVVINTAANMRNAKIRMARWLIPGEPGGVDQRLNTAGADTI
jgi:hypothetical protein